MLVQVMLESMAQMGQMVLTVALDGMEILTTRAMRVQPETAVQVVEPVPVEVEMVQLLQVVAVALEAQEQQVGQRETPPVVEVEVVEEDEVRKTVTVELEELEAQTLAGHLPLVVVVPVKKAAATV